MANPSSDDTQQLAELRHAFLRHLPKRVQGLRRRALRQLSSGFDVNVFQVLFEDTQALAGAAGRHGALEVSELLYRMENLLAPVAESQQAPDGSLAAALQQLLEQLTPQAFPGRRDQGQYAERGDAIHNEEQTAPGRLPVMMKAPNNYWARWADAAEAKRVTKLRSAEEVEAQDLEEAVAVANDGASMEASQAIISALSVSGLDDAVQAFADAEGLDIEAAHAQVEAEAEAAASHSSAQRTVYGLVAESDTFCRGLLQRLQAMGFEVDIFSDASELLEMLGSLVPDLVLVDPAHLEYLGEIGALVKAHRKRADARVSLLALSESSDVAERLQAMRAGADVLLRLPASMDDVLARVSELLDVSGDDPYRVLIVEDDRSQALFADSILRKSGISTRLVIEPLAALQALEDFRPDMILMDLYMPGCDGMELTAIIRERPDFVSTPIVFLSGEQSADKRFEALDAGGDDFLAKPIRPRHLIAAVNNRLRRARVLSKRVRSSVPRDESTGLYFRPWLLEQISDLLAMDDVTESAAAVMFVDVDDASALRERLGLAASDQLMRQLSALVADSVEAHGLAARYGDASFVVLLREMDSTASEAFAHSLRERVGKHLFELDGHAEALGLSVGICPLRLARGDAAELLNVSARCANLARVGKRGVQVFTGRSAAQGSEQDQLLQSIREALDEDRFQLLFQPLVAVDGSGTAQYQTLLRLRLASGVPLVAGRIVPMAEKHGLMPQVDRWVMSRCLTTLDERSRNGQPTRLFVPQSALSLKQDGQIAWLRQHMEARHLKGCELVIDLRLSDVVAHLRPLVAFCLAGRDIGLRFSLQGFEPSPTGFQLLQHLPIDFIKIKPELVARLAAGEAAANAAFRQVVQFAKANERAIIAPQIEDARSAAALWTAGADYIQGHFVQQPGMKLDFDFEASSG